MKQIFVVETVNEISEAQTRKINQSLSMVVEAVTDGECFTQCAVNMPSAIRGIYRLFNADESKSPDEIGSAK